MNLMPLPELLRDCLSEAGECRDTLNDAEMEAWLDAGHDAECSHPNCRNVINGPVKRFHDSVEGGASRHCTLVDVAPWALSEAMSGCYPRREAYDALRVAFEDCKPEAAYDFPRIMRWAAAQADPERAHRDNVDEEAFWAARPELAAIRQFARARRVGPWGMLGCVLVKVSAMVPPDVVLPPTIGSAASLNFDIALAGKSGETKSATIAASDDYITVTPEPERKKPGSGQGLAKCFAYVEKPPKLPPRQVGTAWSVIAEFPEVENLNAAGGRSGSNLLAELRSAWSGERLGEDYSDRQKTIVLQRHRYRLSVVIGVQPLLAGPLFNGADAGTPQRILWLPVSDPGVPDERPSEPGWVKLERWPRPKGLRDKYADDSLLECLAVPQDPSGLTVLNVPQDIIDHIDNAQVNKLRDPNSVDTLASHRNLVRLKTAALLGVFAGRYDKITDEDWELAGVVMQVSDRTREGIQAQITAESQARNVSAGRAAGERKVAEAAVVGSAEDAAVRRVADRILTKLDPHEGQRYSDVRRGIAHKDRQHVEAALELLVDEGRVRVEEIPGTGEAGRLLWPL